MKKPISLFRLVPHLLLMRGKSSTLGPVTSYSVLWDEEKNNGEMHLQENNLEKLSKESENNLESSSIPTDSAIRQ